jgi:3-oxoacyl-[acyl-carrier-protein] synthase II
VSSSSPQRAFVTGCGVVSPLGCGVERFWSALLAGDCAIAPIRSFDVSGLAPTLAAEATGFDAGAWLDPGERARLDRITQFALSAAREALAGAGLATARGREVPLGVIIGTSLGGMAVGEQYVEARHTGRPFDARQLLHMPYAALAAHVARALGAGGPVLSPSIACASGTHAVGLARELIRCGRGEVFVAGGAEALCRFVVAGFNSLRATTATAVRPFDARRDGLALGEGAALLVIESEAHARARGAPCEIEVAGSGTSSDAVHMTAPARDGAGAVRAMRAALDAAGLAPEAVDFVNAHGTGTVYNDAMELAAIEALFGAGGAGIPVDGIKGAIGHTLAAAGAFEAIVCARVLRDGRIPPTTGCEEPDPACRLDLVRGAARAHAVRVALSTSSAFAGNNAAVVLRRA